MNALEKAEESFAALAKEFAEDLARPYNLSTMSDDDLSRAIFSIECIIFRPRTDEGFLTFAAHQLTRITHPDAPKYLNLINQLQETGREIPLRDSRNLQS